ncbi:glutathione S-transferase 1-like [Dermacentor andersoni]|uniref:glutathione S-transferase 1-like n=2 Tax=Dermacentor TaxID=34619 RepID=UPI0024169576|nr:glutathione S-transferase 1-like [Dermacentor andersoni]
MPLSPTHPSCLRQPRPFDRSASSLPRRQLGFASSTARARAIPGVVVSRPEMPQYKLVDYKVPSSGRLAALLFTYAGVEFEYVTYEKSKAAEAEADAPFGSLPVLYADGEMLGADYAICVYIARQYGLEGKDAREATKCATIVTGIASLFSSVRHAKPQRLAPEEDKLAEAKDLREKVPRYLRYFEKLLKDNGTEYFVGNQLTWADLAVTFSCVQLLQRFHGALDSHAHLKAHYERVTTLPVVRAFLDQQQAAA